jgi:hypothetical protein
MFANVAIGERITGTTRLSDGIIVECRIVCAVDSDSLIRIRTSALFAMNFSSATLKVHNFENVPGALSSENVNHKHTCGESRTCCCSVIGIEPNERCPVHGTGEWPPRCGICGKFLKWGIRKEGEAK